ncbi:TrkA family potassium uptake protein [Bacillus atrophaeus]|uniref:potassium channel family protein n=1 Tax=Bacillus atrophaeus TaxID=1452 RepID=UPI00032DECAC|nr:TrkA family potassium uptake protein [Bacillus atrophaeus]AKL86062.1 YuaA [Bacillus atrophaeus UCMB-5137]KXZ19939.1 potassium transporter Trk [Bacillus atrophaeus]MBU5261975.1 TrkA family potassium uptake protein [Bacillus atrophaeus]MCY7946771.1 TrkA family potassium uptake protein [Bacillus atrophaeus]MCY8096441.1 TrkA family potassium uptake protein [Bacillus atrophaeus]
MGRIKNKQFAVIGLGRFGGSICKELHRMGHEVLAVDINEDKVNAHSSFATHSVVANATEENEMNSLGIRNFEYVIVAIGANIQASTLTTLLLKEMDIPNIWVKAQNYYHHKVLEKIGADRIIHPEKDMGIRIAQSLSDENVLDYIDLSEEYSIVELLATKKLHFKSILDLNVRAKYGCTILAIKHNGEINVSPAPEAVIHERDCLVLMGHKRDIKRFENEGM